jgi:hypothetical protein
MYCVVTPKYSKVKTTVGGKRTMTGEKRNAVISNEKREENALITIVMICYKIFTMKLGLITNN